MNSEYFKAITYSVIACQLVNEAKGRHLKCLLGMGLGCLMVTTAFWAYQLGLGVDLSTWGGERSGYARLGGVRADAVMIWPPLLMGCFGVLGLTLSAMASGRFPEQIQRLKMLTVCAFFVSVPPLVATMTHGAYAGFALMTAFVGAAYLDLKRRKLFQQRGSSLAPIVLTLLAASARWFMPRRPVQDAQPHHRALRILPAHVRQPRRGRLALRRVGIFPAHHPQLSAAGRALQ
jgi:hypothetical protein